MTSASHPTGEGGRDGDPTVRRKTDPTVGGDAGVGEFDAVGGRRDHEGR